MKHWYKKSVAIVLCITISSATPAQQSTSFGSFFNQKSAIALGCAIPGACIAYYAYQAVQHYIEEQVIENGANSCVLALTFLNLSEEQKHHKARLINRIKRLLARLQPEALAQEFPHLSPEHRKIIDAAVARSTGLLTLIDRMRSPNTYENLYLQPSFIESYIENRLMKTILLSMKPNHECTPAELDAKKDQVTRRKKILERVRTKIQNIWIPRLGRSALALTMLLAA